MENEYNTSYCNTTIWKHAFHSGGYVDIKLELANSLKSIRKNASTLTSLIHADLPQFTVHDVTHLDALWGVAAQIAGPESYLNPLETFILGGAIYLHDAALSAAAYPEGRKQIEKHPRWVSILQSIPPSFGEQSEIISAAITKFIRLQHADEAAHLVDRLWETGDGKFFIIENSNHRVKFGQIIGAIARSHWLPPEVVADEFDLVKPAPQPYPVEWKIDLLKIALLLRTADAAHIDDARAPSFLFALKRSMLEPESILHWTFQNKISQVERRGDALYYSSMSDFSPDQSSAWWLMYDTARSISLELSSADRILADIRGTESRFLARRVANIESPKIFSQSVRVFGWMPEEANVQIGNVLNVISRLGGAQLYGDSPVAAMREIIANARDAIYTRKAIEGGTFNSEISIKIVKDAEDINIEVSDTGIGMTIDDVRKYLLNFGSSGWVQTLEAHEAKIDRSRLSGKFGIGFFSIFMIGEHVIVKTRKFDKSYADGIAITFDYGLQERPLVRKLHSSEKRPMGGTSVQFRLKRNTLKKLRESNGFRQFGFSGLISAIAATIDISISIDEFGKITTIHPFNIEDASTEEILFRTEAVLAGSFNKKIVEKFKVNMRPIYRDNGSICGRIFLCRENFVNGTAVVTNNGIAAAFLSNVCGVIEGYPSDASRQHVIPDVSRREMDRWIGEQVALLLGMNLTEEEQSHFGSLILMLDCDSDRLKVFLTEYGWMDRYEIFQYIKSRDEIFIYYNLHTSAYQRVGDFIIAENCICCDNALWSVLGGGFIDFDGVKSVFKTELFLHNILADLMLNAWSIPSGIWGLTDTTWHDRRKEVVIGHVNGAPISDSVVSFTKGEMRDLAARLQSTPIIESGSFSRFGG